MGCLIKPLSLFLILIVFAVGVFCVDLATNPVIPAGYHDSEEFFDPDGFQDYTDYCKYYYRDASRFENNSEYHKIDKSEIDEVKGYFTNFREWMATEKRLSDYDFDIRCITVGDYVRIVNDETNESYEYADYDVYFFDTETCILYYIHANI